MLYVAVLPPPSLPVSQILVFLGIQGEFKGFMSQEGRERVFPGWKTETRLLLPALNLDDWMDDACTEEDETISRAAHPLVWQTNGASDAYDPRLWIRAETKNSKGARRDLSVRSTKS